MFKHKIVYGIIFVLMLIMYCYLGKEHFNTNFNINKDIMPDENNVLKIPVSKNYINYFNGREHIFNNNYNAVWLKPQVAHNNTNVNDLPSGINDYKEKVTSHTYYIHIDAFKYLINEFNKKHTIDYLKFKEHIQSFGKLNEITDNLGNKKIWKTDYSYDPNKNLSTIFIPSKYPDVNKIVNYFISKLNLIFKYNSENSEHFKIYKSFKFYKFFILKYKIVKFYTSLQNNIKIFEIRICLIRQNDINVMEVYIIGYIDINNKIILQNILFIGNGPLSNYLLRPGFTNQYYDVHDPKIKDNITFKDVDNILKEHNQLDNANQLDNTNQFSLENQYRCFDLKKDGFVIDTNNKLDCENEIDWYGRIKNYGIWDKPCVSDNECIYHERNKNYDNSYGKCMESGYCQMPINSKKLGYHFEKTDSKPKCYNCNTSKWTPFTQLDECCERQDKTSKNYDTKYNFLNGPDYAYDSDLNTRINHNIKKKYDNKNLYIKYDDLFNKDKFNYYFE